MPTNEHVEDGLFDHRRVNDPDLAHTHPQGRRRRPHPQRRTSPPSALGLTGVLDLVEEKDGEPYPVETKHGSAPRDDDGRPTAWDNDAVQLCAQALLLEEASGRPVARGVQSLRRHPRARRGPVRRRPARQDPRRHRAASASCPPATRRRSRCRPSCATAASAARSPRSACRRRRSTRSAGRDRRRRRRRRPASPASSRSPTTGRSLYLQEPGSHVGKRSEHLVVRKDGQELNRVPMHAVRQVVVFGNVQVSTQALETLAAERHPGRRT